MVDLLNLEPVQVNKDLRGKYILIYGAPKIGKTTLANSFEKNLLLAFEPGYNALNNAYVVPVTKWSEFKKVLKQLEQPAVKEKFHTITIDTADLCWDACEKYICASNMDEKTGETPKALGDIPWGKGYDLCKKEFDNALRQIAMLGYGLVIISHETTRTIKTESGEEYQKIMPTLADRPKLIVNRLVDIIAYLRLSNEDQKRYIYTRGNEKFEAGSRFPLLKPKIEMSYDNLVNELYNAIEEQAKQDNVTLTDSSENSFFKKGREFSEVIEEARNVFTQLIDRDKEKYAVMTNEILMKVFGRPTKLSETTPSQQELVEVVLEEWKALL